MSLFFEITKFNQKENTVLVQKPRLYMLYKFIGVYSDSANLFEERPVPYFI